MKQSKPQLTKDQALDVVREHGFSRIAESIAFLWGEPEFIEYMKDLILPKREGRVGFPKQVMAALLRLDHLHFIDSNQTRIVDDESVNWGSSANKKAASG